MLRGYIAYSDISIFRTITQFKQHIAISILCPSNVKCEVNLAISSHQAVGSHFPMLMEFCMLVSGVSEYGIICI